MTEKSLLLKCAVADHFFIVGTDFPAARVFDTTTSALAAVVELPLRSRNVSLAALTLTSVAVQRVEEKTEGHAATAAAAAAAGRRREAEQLVDDAVATYYAAVGLSNGTLLLHDIRRDALLAHVQVSETQQPLTSLQLCGGFAFCLAANSMLYVVALHDAAAGPCLRLRVQPDASSVAVTKLQDTTTASAQQVYRVMIAGPTNALYEVRSLGSSGVSQDVPQVHATKLIAFPSQGTSAEFAWISDVPASGNAVSLPAVTASAQDGMVRLWDLHYSTDASASSAVSLLLGRADASAATTSVVARCRRTLLCGQRILNVAVLPGEARGGSPRKGNYVMVTTLTGSVLLWSLGDALLPPVVEPMPLKPDVVLVSAVPSGRLLFGALRAAQRGAGDAAANALSALEVTLLRGRFAMPLFETRNIGAAVEAANNTAAAVAGGTSAAAANTARRTALSTLALGVAGSTAVTVAELPLTTASTTTLTERQDVEYLLEHTTDAATSSFVVMDTVWTAHQQQVAAKASQSMSEAFKAPQLYHAKSIQDLPVKQLTLEQRLQQVAREDAAARRRKNASAAGRTDASGAEAYDEEAGAGRSVLSHHALGLATIPLYQALHANDTSAVMDLLNMTGRSSEGMRATVLSLQLPYCLQLLQVISERLGLCSKAVEKAVPNASGVATAAAAAASGEQAAVDAEGNPLPSTNGNAHSDTAAVASGTTRADSVLRGGVAAFSIRSSLLEWIDAILHYRGSELLAVQREANARAARKAAGTSTPEGDAADAVSPPRDFLAPILHHYQELCAQYDKLAVLYGRLSVFKAVRPSQKNQFTNIPRQSLGSNIEMARPASVNGHLATSSNTASTNGTRARRLHLSEKSSVVDSDIIFPFMFKESRSRSGHRVVRVHSRLELARLRQAKANKNAALKKRARELARQQLRARAAQGAHSILDGDDDMKKGGGVDVMDQLMMEEMKNGGELDLDALEAMDLGGGDSDVDSSDDASVDVDADGEDAGSEVDGDDGASRRRGSKKQRKEAVDEMLADDEEGDGDDLDDEDADAGLDSSEAEFSSASDDEVRSDVLSDGSSEEEEEGEEGEESEAGSDVEAGSQHSGDDSGDDGDDDDDGMGEDMQELLAQHDDDADRTERRKSKKVRTD